MIEQEKQPFAYTTKELCNKLFCYPPEIQDYRFHPRRTDDSSLGPLLEHVMFYGSWNVLNKLTRPGEDRAGIIIPGFLLFQLVADQHPITEDWEDKKLRLALFKLAQHHINGATISLARLELEGVHHTDSEAVRQNPDRGFIAGRAFLEMFQDFQQNLLERASAPGSSKET